MVIELTHRVLILTLDTVPPIRADEESDIRERGTATKDNSGPTLQITQKGNRAEGPHTHTILLQTHIICTLAHPPHVRDRRCLSMPRHLHFATLQIALNWMNRGENIRTMQVIVARTCLLYTSPSPRDLSTSRMPSSA